MRPALNLDNVPAGHPEARSGRLLAIAVAALAETSDRRKKVIVAKFAST
jgi:hypothetical protein